MISKSNNWAWKKKMKKTLAHALPETKYVTALETAVHDSSVETTLNIRA